MAGHQAVRTQLHRPFGGVRCILERQVERGRLGEACGDGSGAFAPSLCHRFGQSRRGGQFHPALGQCAEHAMRQPLRSARQQRERGRDHRMRRRVEPQPLRQHQPQHRARLGVLGQNLARRAVDQGVEIDQPTQRFRRNCAGEPRVGRRQSMERRRLVLLQRFAPAQDAIEHAQRRAAGWQAGHIAPGFGLTGFSHA